ncbi:MAG TPA: hypothetical protein DD490_21515 [Acidobacteria bacterium]|nr:hypothetical protein [Acidobacteriota bacterium]
MPDSDDLSHHETQTALPGPLLVTGFWDKVGTWALPASSLSLASAFVLVVTILFLVRNREMRSLFLLSWKSGLVIAVVAAAIAWSIVILCGRRPGRLWPRVWALIVAGLCTASVILVPLFPEATWVSALTVAGAAAAVTLGSRLVRLPPDSGMIPKIAPLTALLVLAGVLPAVAWLGDSIVAGKRERVAAMIEQVRRWTTEVAAVAGRDWTGGGWEDANRAAASLAQIQPAAKLDLSLWREAFYLERDQELAQEVGKLLQATAQGFDEDRVPRVSRLRDPAFYFDPVAKRWEESAVFPEASETVGRYFQEMGRIFQELDLQVGLAESTALAELKKSYLEESRPGVVKQLSGQMQEWTDHWAVFRVPGHDTLLGFSEMPLGKLLKSPIPTLGIPASDLPVLLSLSFQRVRSFKLIPGCRPLAPYTETKDGSSRQYSRLDCFSYGPRTDTLGAWPRIEMRLVYASQANRGLLSDQKPSEIYFLFPLPEGRVENEFQKQVMSDLAEAVRETTEREVAPIDRSGSTENGFRVRGEGLTITVYKPSFEPLYEKRKALVVRAERKG